MITPPEYRPLSIAQSSTLLLLLAMLFLFAWGPFLVWGGLSFILLVGYHLLTDHRYSSEQIRDIGLLVPHILVYLLLCTLVIWSTTGKEESPYWPVFLLPIAVAATNLGLKGTLATCAGASTLFISQVPPAMYLDPHERREEVPELAMFCLTFFFVGVLVQTFSEQRRRQLDAQKELNEKLLANQRALEYSLSKLQAAEESLRRKERLAALGEMSAGIAHEIRNPLGIISSSAQLLGNRLSGADAGSEQLLEIIQEEASRLNGLISDFLTFGRPLEPQRSPCDLGELLSRTVEHLQGLAQKQGVSVTVEVSEGLAVALVDRDLMQQVLLNLLLNALEATPEGGKVMARTLQQQGGLVIEVEDTGCGVPEELRSKIFNPFFTTKDKGAGLGLANAHKIVESHGGELSLVRSTEAGSTFRMLLPQQGD